MMRRLHSLVAAVVFLPLAALAAQPQGAPAPSVSVTRTMEREITERAVVTGTLVPREEVLVAPELEGLRITEVLAEEGDTVTKDQVLAHLATDLLETELARNNASFARAEAGVVPRSRSQLSPTSRSVRDQPRSTDMTAPCAWR